MVCTGEYHVTKMQIRNERMVDDSDLVLAFYDGSTGGTHNCIRYAQRQHKSVMNVYRSWEKHRAGTGVATDSPSEGAVS